MASDSAKSAEPQDDFSLRNWRTLLLVAVLMAASLTPIWITTHFPSQNGPWYLLQVQMFKNLDNPAFDYADYYEINWHPKPHMLHNVLVLLLSYLLPLLVAEKVALSIYALLVPLSIFYFLSTVAPDRKVLGLLAFLMIHTYVFYRGYHNYSLSVPLFFFTFAFWHRHRDHFGWKHALVAAVLATLTWLAHLFTFAFLVGAIGYLRLLETRSLRKATVAVLSVTWPGWLLLADHYLLVAHKAAWVKPEDTVLLAPHVSLEYAARKMFYSVSDAAYVLAVLPWLWIVALIALRLFRRRHEAKNLGRAFFGDPLLVVLGTVAICYFFVPYKILGWHYANIRLIPFILGLSLACAAPLVGLKQRALKAGFVASVSLAALGVYGFVSLRVVEMHADVQEYISGIDRFEGNALLLPILTENEPFGQVRPVTRCHEYYHIEKAGANGLGVAGCANTHVMMWHKAYPNTQVFPRFDQQSPAESMRRIKATYDYVLLWGEDDDWAKRLDDYRFTLVHHEGRLRMFCNTSTPEEMDRHAACVTQTSQEQALPSNDDVRHISPVTRADAL